MVVYHVTLPMMLLDRGLPINYLLNIYISINRTKDLDQEFAMHTTTEELPGISILHGRSLVPSGDVEESGQVVQLFI